MDDDDLLGFGRPAIALRRECVRTDEVPGGSGLIREPCLDVIRPESKASPEFDGRGKIAAHVTYNIDGALLDAEHGGQVVRGEEMFHHHVSVASSHMTAPSIGMTRGDLLDSCPGW